MNPPKSSGTQVQARSLTYVDVTWETCAATEPDKQQREQKEDRGDREAPQPHVSSSNSTDGRRGTTGVIPFTPGPVRIHLNRATD